MKSWKVIYSENLAIKLKQKYILWKMESKTDFYYFSQKYIPLCYV